MQKNIKQFVKFVMSTCFFVEEIIEAVSYIYIKKVAKLKG